MEDQSLEVAKAVGEAAEDLSMPSAVFAATLMGTKLLGPSVREIGEAIADHVRRARFRSQAKALGKTLAWLEKEGIPYQAVDPKVLAPWFTGVGLEDETNESMIDRWAALLANAASGADRGAKVLPSFPRILAELSPEEAAILETLYRDPDPNRVPSLYRRHGDDADLARDDPLFYTRCFNLERLGLLEASWENVQVTDTDPPDYRHTVAYIEGTALGLSFVVACLPPTGSSPSPS
jgi:hypothetical protein